MKLRSHPDTLLIDHLREVGEKSREAVSEKSLNLSLANKKSVELIAYLIGIGHDFGKGTTYFQDVIHERIDNHPKSHHALISSLFTYHLVDQVTEGSILPELSYLSVRYHHGNLSSPDVPLNKERDVNEQWKTIQSEHGLKIREIYSELLEGVDLDSKELLETFDQFLREELSRFHRRIDRELYQNMHESSDDDRIESFLLCNFLFSILVDSDKKSAAKLETNRFNNACEPTIDVEGYLEYLREKNPEKFDPDTSLNRRRNQFFNQVTNHDQLKSKNHLYTLTAPTGIGKTFTAYETASRLKTELSDNRRIIYSLPFTSIIDQNYEELRQIMEWQDEFDPECSEYLLKHHYLSTMSHESEDPGKLMNDSARYLREKMTNETWESGHVVTTFVQLFHSVIGNKNKFLKKFHNLVNSIIILDEIQNIDPDYYGLVREIFSVMADSFDTYFVLMTATQPEIFSPEQSIELSQAEEYFTDDIFNRVTVDLIDDLSPMFLGQLNDRFIQRFEQDNALIVLNTKASTLDLFNQFCSAAELEAYNKYCLTTNLTPADRMNRIEKIRDELDREKPIIVVSTQLIEAGVDLSFQTVWRDLGPFDSIVQVAGRCNRHGEMAEKGTVRVVSLKDDRDQHFARYVYSQSLLESTHEVLTNEAEIEASDFLTLSKDYFGSLDYHLESKQLLEGIKNLNYTTDREGVKCVEDFQLIDELTFQEDIIVCTSPDVQEWLIDYDELYQQFSETEGFSDERDKLVGKTLLLKKKLSDYTISVNQRHLEKYLREKSDDIRQTVSKNLHYVPFEHVDKVYSSETGFIANPEKENLSTTKVF